MGYLDKNFMWLVLIELLIIGIIVLIKIIIEHYEKKKIEKILNYFEKRAQENSNYEERVNLLKQILSAKSNKC